MANLDCLFCKIIKGEIPSKKAYEDENVYAFHDINPQAPTHILIIPKKHIATNLDITESDKDIIGQLYLVANKLAKDAKIAEPGFRVVMNCNKDAGQAVYHIHLHLLGGRKMSWPPG
jgi:histidine triad (HIT) family protein